MKINKEEIGNGQIKFSVTVTGEKWEAAQKKGYNKITKNIQIPGFRKGNVPKDKLKGMVRDGDIVKEAVDVIIGDAYDFMMAEEKPNIIARPSVTVEKADTKSATINFLCQLPPKIELGKYKDLGVKKDKVEATKEEVQKEVDALLARGGASETKEGAAANGDITIIDFEGFKDGVAFDGGKAEKFSLELGSGQFIPGFEEQLVGSKAGDELDVELSFPENYPQPNLAGAPVTFKVKLHEVKSKVKPELNDEFAAGLNFPGVTNKKELIKIIEDAIVAQKSKAANAKFESDVFDKIISKSTIEIPASILKEEMKSIRSQFENNLAQQGTNIKKFKEMTKQTDEQINAELEKDAVKRIKCSFILEKVAAEEKIEVSEKDIEAEFKVIADANKVTVKEVKEKVKVDQVRFNLRNRQILDIITK